jgi:hypothetical protein
MAPVADTGAMQPQEQPIPGQPVYYVPVQAVAAPPAAPAPATSEESPKWARDLDYRTSGQSVALAFVGIIALVNLVLTIVLFVMIHGALHPFGG